MLQRKYPELEIVGLYHEYIQFYVWCYKKKMQCTMYIQNDSIDWCFEKVFQNAFDKKLLTDRFTINQKIQKYKRNTKIQNMYLSNALKNSRETRPVGKFFTRIVIAFISWECLSSSETPSWGVISPTIHSVK